MTCYIYCNIGSNGVFFIITCKGRCRGIIFLGCSVCMLHGIFCILGIRVMLWNVAFRNQGWYIWNQGLYVCNLQVMLFELPFIRQNTFFHQVYHRNWYNHECMGMYGVSTIYLLPITNGFPLPPDLGWL